MTRPNIIMKADAPAGTADGDFAALANQLIEDNWHLPPGGDQSWREQDALRIFSAYGESEINDTPEHESAMDAEQPDDEKPAQYQPGFRPHRVASILLPLAMATCLASVIVAISAPQILSPAFWNSPEPEKASETDIAPMTTPGPVTSAPVREASWPVPDRLRPSLDSERSPAESARVFAMKAARPYPGSGAPPVQHGPAQVAKLRLVQASAALRPFPPRKIAAHLPPIGETYFAGHPTAGTNRKGRAARHETPANTGRLPPIGEAYFSSHRPAATAWRAEAARWDEGASAIQTQSKPASR